MEEPTHLSDMEAFRESSLNSLVELQRFLAEELEDLDLSPDNYQRAFRPLTDGLGLEAPKRKEESAAAVSSKPLALPDLGELFPETESDDAIPALPAEPKLAPMAPVEEAIAEPVRPRRDAEAHFTEAPKPAPAPVAAPETPRATEAEPPIAGAIAVPPPMPQPSLFRRLQAALIDDAFVLVLWCGALVITANLMTGFSAGLSLDVLRAFSRPIFLRFAALEFATLWLGYFAVGIGALDMTFGMWVWGIRVTYGDHAESRFARKVSRIVLSFLFFAPIVPSFLLLFRRRGRNLLDSLSGTGLYCSGI